MDLEYRLPVLSVLWKLLIFAAFPLLVWGYLKVVGISFAQLDIGSNPHKSIVFGLYLILAALWWWLNPKVQRLLQRRK